MILHERMTTQLGEKMAPARRVEAKKPPLVVARYLFEATKRRASRLNWRLFSHNIGNQMRVSRP